jgi:hypothetical protein
LIVSPRNKSLGIAITSSCAIAGLFGVIFTHAIVPHVIVTLEFTNGIQGVAEETVISLQSIELVTKPSELIWVLSASNVDEESQTKL